VPIRVPRVRSEQAEIPLRTTGAARHGRGGRGVAAAGLYGILVPQLRVGRARDPGRDRPVELDGVALVRGGECGELKEVPERELKDEHYVALFLDGKSFADTMLVIALGVDGRGHEAVPGLRRADTRTTSTQPFLRTLSRAGSLLQGLLVVIDGGKGLRRRARGVPEEALVQRCMCTSARTW